MAQDNEKSPQAQDKAAEKKVRCRVVGVNYSQHHQGDEIEVTARELRRVGPHVLISLDEERRRIAEQVKPAQDRKAIDADIARRAAWKKLEQDRERLDREWRLGEARQVSEAGGGPLR